MDIGFEIGPNVPTGLFALHGAVAAFFLYLGVANATGGEPIGLLLNALIGVLLLAAGVATARIVARRD